MTDELINELRAGLAHDRAYRDGLQTGFRLGQAGAADTYESMKRHYTREISLAANTLREIDKKDCGCGLGDKCPDPPVRNDLITTFGDDILAACKAMKAAFGDPMTRRVLGGHNEAQQEAILAASAAISTHDNPTDLEVRVREFLMDWRKGDFELTSLAARDAEAMERALSSQEKRKRQ